MAIRVTIIETVPEKVMPTGQRVRATMVIEGLDEALVRAANRILLGVMVLVSLLGGLLVEQIRVHVIG